MAFDAHKNFAASLVATAPSPAASGTSLVVTAGEGTKFPTAPFNATVWPAGARPSSTNAEIVRVTAIGTDTFTVTRTQEGTSARTIVVGDNISANITALSLTDAETAGRTLVGDLLFTDATFDIGKSAATRPRDGFFSRNGVFGGTLGVTGVGTFTAQSVHNGGVSLGANGQVAFPSTQNASANANTLDDYKEWTFTPTVIGQTSGAATYTVQAGQYTKIGAHVFFSIYITTATNGTIAGAVQIGGLPFTIRNTTNAYGGVNVGYFTGLGSSVSMLGGYLQPNTSVIQMWKLAAGGATTVAAVVNTDIAATEFILSGHYVAVN